MAGPAGRAAQHGTPGVLQWPQLGRTMVVTWSEACAVTLGTWLTANDATTIAAAASARRALEVGVVQAPVGAREVFMVRSFPWPPGRWHGPHDAPKEVGPTSGVLLRSARGASVPLRRSTACDPVRGPGIPRARVGRGRRSWGFG